MGRVRLLGGPQGDAFMSVSERVKQLVVLGREHYGKREFEQAERVLREVLQEHDKYADVHDMLGVICHSRGNFVAAEHHFERALELNPAYTEAALNLAVTYNDRGKYDKAKEIYAKIKAGPAGSGSSLYPFARGKIAIMHAAVHSVEGTAYRVDVRLRPHGTLGPLAASLSDTVRYYKTDARAWERQVMIRSRCSAGDARLFKRLYCEIEPLVFSEEETVENALANARASKDKIDLTVRDGGYNVKLGRGCIRENEFIAQALQLAYGGRDKWLREGHTLISLARLADRGHLSESELTELSSAYEFLRRTEHVLQMENGLQTHTVPDDTDKRALLGRRIEMADGGAG